MNFIILVTFSHGILNFFRLFVHLMAYANWLFFSPK